MPISTVASTPATATQTTNLGIEAFLKILTTQLNFQDPLKPIDNQQFMAQIAQFTALEQTQQMNTKLEQLITNQAALQSVGLIGRTVEISSNGTTVTGAVTALSFSGSSPVLSLTATDGTTLSGVSLSSVVSVH